MVDAEKQKLWEERLEIFLDSGLSQAAWCREQGLRSNQLGYWLRKLKPGASVPNNTRWVSMQVPVSRESGVSLQVGNINLKIESGFDEQTLADVIRTVMTLC